MGNFISWILHERGPAQCGAPEPSMVRETLKVNVAAKLASRSRGPGSIAYGAARWPTSGPEMMLPGDVVALTQEGVMWSH
ncbi:hypothetical protein WME91_56520 [Sorangium sp. So ce269]